jgi:hypothetical protein
MRHKPLIYRDDGFSRCQAPDFLDLEHLNVGQIDIVEINNGRITVAKTYTGAIPGTIPPINYIGIINGGVNGSILILRCQNTTIVDNVGNLQLTSNFTMNSPADTLMLLKAGNNWLELSRSNNS